MIILGKEIVGEFDVAQSREWLETNGLGGFASGTISGSNSRRYHGLLTAATEPPLGRLLLLSKLEETVILNGERFELSCNRYPGTVFPKGFHFLTSFRLDPFPIWEYEVGGVRITKSLFMPHGRNATVCRWEVSSSSDSIVLEVRPLVAFRNHHHLRSTSDHFSFRQTDTQNVMIEMADFQTRLQLSHSASELIATGEWYRNFEYSIEEERGFDFRENLYQPFILRFDLSQRADVVASTDGVSYRDADVLERTETERRNELVAEAAGEFERHLTLAADQYIVRRGQGSTIIAGYPWFSDWGRDTMIALQGLTLCTGRKQVARDILLEFSRHISMGMIPNRFPDEAEAPDYNTADATLWYFEALRAYVEGTDDIAILRTDLYEKLVDIISWHMKGTRHGIHVETDGLLYAGEAGTQLTWMDAKYGEEVFTPRIGKPVEIQALWFNALKVMEGFARLLRDGKGADLYRTTAALAQRSFNNVFWNDEDECLFDVIDGNFRDRSIRPNQIFAVSLPHEILADRAKQKKVVERVEGDLLTPYGLRSLAATDPRYRGRYEGSPHDRDSAYHQGPVWGWLIGPFIDAFIKMFPERKEESRGLLIGFESHLLEAGIGQISEIFDGDYPHAPRGCPAQAWSVGEALRVYKKIRKSEIGIGNS